MVDSLATGMAQLAVAGDDDSAQPTRLPDIPPEELQVRIYVGNLSWSINDKGLADLFSPFGEVEKAEVIYDRVTGQSKGFGFVTFRSGSSVEPAIRAMHKRVVENRPLRVNRATKPGSGPQVPVGPRAQAIMEQRRQEKALRRQRQMMGGVPAAVPPGYAAALPSSGGGSGGLPWVPAASLGAQANPSLYLEQMRLACQAAELTAQQPLAGVDGAAQVQRIQEAFAAAWMRAAAATGPLSQPAMAAPGWAVPSALHAPAHHMALPGATAHAGSLGSFYPVLPGQMGGPVGSGGVGASGALRTATGVPVVHAMPLAHRQPAPQTLHVPAAAPGALAAAAAATGGVLPVSGLPAHAGGLGGGVPALPGPLHSGESGSSSEHRGTPLSAEPLSRQSAPPLEGSGPLFNFGVDASGEDLLREGPPRFQSDPLPGHAAGSPYASELLPPPARHFDSAPVEHIPVGSPLDGSLAGQQRYIPPAGAGDANRVSPDQEPVTGVPLAQLGRSMTD